MAKADLPAADSGSENEMAQGDQQGGSGCDGGSPAETATRDEAPTTIKTFRERLDDEAENRDYFELQCEQATTEIGPTERSDGFINEGMAVHWNQSVDMVTDFAAGLARRIPGDWDALEPGLRKELLCWTPRAEELLGDPQRAGYLYAARIWHTLDEQLFSASAETNSEWLGPHWTRFARMKEALKTKGHDMPWNRGNMEAAYHMWRWYTAIMTHRSFCAFPTDDLAKVIAGHVISDLATLVGVSSEEKGTWTPKVENFCSEIALAARSMTLTHSKTWVTWRPETYEDGQSGFRVSSATDEGCDVMMTPWPWTPWVPLDDPGDLNGREVHLVVSPALVGSFLFTGDLTHHYVAPMTVIVDGHLSQGGSRPKAEPEVASEGRSPAALPPC